MWTWLTSSEKTSRQSGGEGRSPTTPPAPGGRKGQAAGDSRPIELGAMLWGGVASQHPKRIRELMAYQTTITREARRCGGAGWQGYDSMFRQHAANLPNIDWSKVNNSLFAVTFMAQQNGRGKTCELCLEPDHVAAECALAPAKPSEPPPPRQPAGLGGMPTGQRRASTSQEWRPREEYNGPRGQAANRPPGDRQERVCYSWNDCTCRFINCRYRYECARCGGEHRASTLVH